MEESDILELWRKELNFDDWWIELLGGQNIKNPAGFNLDIPADMIPWTEVNTGNEIFRKVGTYLSYVELTKTWYAWDGRVHTPCSGDILIQLLIKEYQSAVSSALTYVQNIVEAKAQVAENNQDDTGKIKAITDVYAKGYLNHRRFRDHLASLRGLQAMVGVLKLSFTKPDDYFDNDQKYLVVRNCVFNLDKLRKGDMNFREIHSPDKAVTCYLDVDYDRDLGIEDSLWIQFLNSSLKDSEDKEDVLRHVRKVIGASMMGESKMRTIFNFVGPPSSGKSVMIETLWKLGREGSEYCIMPDSRSITKVQGNNFEQDRFKSKRFIAISEPSSREEIDDDFLKRFTGDEWMETRTLHARSSGWAPQGALFISSNQVLRINSRDQAIVDRVQVIEFPYHFVDNPDSNKSGERKKDKSLGERLMKEDEKSKILNWIIMGMIDYQSQNRKLDPPQSILDQQSKVVSTASAPLRWILDQLEDVKMQDVSNNTGHYQANSYLYVAEAYRLFQIWCVEYGERTTSRRYFEEDIGRKYPIIRYNGEKQFSNLVRTTVGVTPPSHKAIPQEINSTPMELDTMFTVNSSPGTL